jgi:predicted nucleic acid-binding protein
MNDPATIFVDSDVFVSILRKDDSSHQKAKKLYLQLEKLNVSFATSNYVFAEVTTVISQKISHHAAIEFISNMRSPDSIYHFIRITPEIEEMAIEIFKKQTSKNISFVDCTNMALVKHDNLDAIFSFDEIYKKNGYKLVNEL